MFDPITISLLEKQNKLDANVASVASQLADIAKFASPAALWRKTTTGNPATCYPVPGSPLLPRIAFTATQEGEGDPSPENIRPIIPALASGGKVKVRRTGKNLMCISDYTGALANGFQVVSSGGVISITGTPSGTNSNGVGTVNDITLLPPGTYTVSINKIIPAIVRVAVPSPFTLINSIDEGSTSKTFTITEPKKVTIYIGFPSGQVGVSQNITNLLVQIENGSTATTYEPYSGDTYEWTAPQDIWGGNVDWETGMLIVTHAQIASYAGESVPDGWISSTGALTTGAQVVYPLATPTVIPLTDLPAINALPQLDRYTPRQNVLTVDKGALTVGYAKSPIRESDELAAAIAALS